MSKQLKNRLDHAAATTASTVHPTKAVRDKALEAMLKHYSEELLLNMPGPCFRGLNSAVAHVIDLGGTVDQAAEYLSEVPLTVWPAKMTFEEWIEIKQPRATLSNNVVKANFGRR